MSETTKAFVYIYRTPPSREWFARELSTGIGVVNLDRDVAPREFAKIWAGRGEYQLKECEPPRPRRHDAPATDAPTVENISTKERAEKITECYRRWSKRLHPDVHSGDTLATEAMTALTELYELAVR